MARTAGIGIQSFGKIRENGVDRKTDQDNKYGTGRGCRAGV